MATQNVLAALVLDQRGLAVSLPWPWEIERWIELLVAIMSVSPGPKPSELRALAGALTYDCVGGVEQWATLTKTDPAYRHAMELFGSYGWVPREAAAQIRTLSRFAGKIQGRYQGHIQRVLRKHCERLRDEVATLLRASGVGSTGADGAATLWLQNVLSAPLALKTPAVAALMKKHRITASQWLDEADALGINVAILDDVVDAAASGQRLGRGSRS
jgi:hypothetical protein